MNIQAAEMDFLTGKRFSNDFRFRISHLGSSFGGDRLEYLCKIVEGKRIIHVGCVDHPPLIEAKRKTNRWLHQILSKSAATCTGIDINASGCELVKSLGFEDVHCLDLTRDPLPNSILARHYDYIVLGEMIEHVNNPVEFLTHINTKFVGLADKLITTTPNVFRAQNLINSLIGREDINSDHRYWFSPYTLAKVLVEAGYSDISVDLVWYSSSQKWASRLGKSLVGMVFPSLKDCLMAVAEIKTQ